MTASSPHAAEAGEVMKRAAFVFLWDWIERHSCNLPCENDAKDMLLKISGGELW